MTAAGPADLNMTGIWEGLYGVAGQEQPYVFVATLIDTAGQLSGSTHESGADAQPPCELIYGAVSGLRHGVMVHFVKSHALDPPQEMEFQGVLSGDGTEIHGTWLIPRLATGRFVMLRSAGEPQAAEHEAVESL